MQAAEGGHVLMCELRKRIIARVMTTMRSPRRASFTRTLPRALRSGNANDRDSPDSSANAFEGADSAPRPKLVGR
jgi:hypothetical protein